jgi:hypothetical protein
MDFMGFAQQQQQVGDVNESMAMHRSTLRAHFAKSLLEDPEPDMLAVDE